MFAFVFVFGMERLGAMTGLDGSGRKVCFGALDLRLRTCRCFGGCLDFFGGSDGRFVFQGGYDIDHNLLWLRLFEFHAL